MYRALLLPTIAAAILVFLASSLSFMALAQSELDIRRTFYFESHGRDDGREWRAAFLKGLRVIKTDFNFQEDPETCVAQQRVNPGGLKNASSFPNGCFVNTHYFDKKVLNYNVPADIIDFIAAAENQKDIFSPLRASQSGPVIFQMCLKNRPGGDCPVKAGSSYAKWLALYDDFYNLARSKISATLDRNGVQFVFDSLSADGDSCIILPPKRYGNWNSTWTGNINSALNNSGANAVMQMPNMDWDGVLSPKSSWNKVAKLSPTSWGKFHSESTAYPIVFWEPSAEMAMELWYDWFLKNAIYRPAGVLTAYNPDPAMHHTLTAPVTKRFAHSLVGDYEMEGAVSASIPVVPTGNKQQEERTRSSSSSSSSRSPYVLHCAHSRIHLEKLNNHIQCGFHEFQDHSQLVPNTNSLGYIPDELVSNFSLPLLHIAVEGPFATSSFPHAYRVMLIDSQNDPSKNSVHFLTMGLTGGGVRFQSPPKWQASPCAGFSIATGTEGSGAAIHAATTFSTASSSSSQQTVVYGVILGSKNKNDTVGGSQEKKPLFVQALTSQGAPSNTASCPRWTRTVVNQIVVNDVCSNSTSKSCTISAAQHLHRHASTPRRERFSAKTRHVDSFEQLVASGHVSWFGAGIAAHRADENSNGVFRDKVIACFSVDRSVYCSTAEFTAQGGIINSSIIPPPTSAPVKLGVGHNPTVAFAASSPSNRNNNGTSLPHAAFLIRYGYSFCFNTMLVDDNTGEFFPIHQCDLRDSPVKEVIPSPMQSYVFGRNISLFESRLLDGNKHLNGFASTCDSQLLHGVFDSSVDAGAPMLFPAEPNSFDGDVAAGDYVVAVPMSSLTLGCLSTCGSSAPGGGKVRMDVFPMPGMIFNYSSSP